MILPVSSLDVFVPTGSCCFVGTAVVPGVSGRKQSAHSYPAAGGGGDPFGGLDPTKLMSAMRRNPKVAEYCAGLLLR